MSDPYAFTHPLDNQAPGWASREPLTAPPPLWIILDDREPCGFHAWNRMKFGAPDASDEELRKAGWVLVETRLSPPTEAAT